jgi:hypothetical protein
MYIRLLRVFMAARATPRVAAKNSQPARVGWRAPLIVPIPWDEGFEVVGAVKAERGGVSWASTSPTSTRSRRPSPLFVVLKPRESGDYAEGAHTG